MAKYKKNSSKSDSKLHMNSNKKKLKHKSRKIKEREIYSVLNHGNKHHSHPNGKHTNNREISNLLNSSWDIEKCGISRFKYANGKVKRHKCNKNKHRSRHPEKDHLSHSSFNFNDEFSTKCSRNHLNNLSWNVETSNVSSINNKHNVKKRKKCKPILTEANINVPSKVKLGSDKKLLGSILISDTDSQTDDDESIETIVQNKYNNNIKLNVNFVNFNTENMKGNSSKTSTKKSLNNEKKYSKNLEESHISETGDIKPTNNKLNSIKKCMKKGKQIEIDKTSNLERNYKNIENNSKLIRKSKNKKARMEITDISTTVKSNNEIEVHESIDSSELNDSTKSDTEIEILDSTSHSSELNENLTSSAKNDAEVEIIESTGIPNFFVNLTINDSEVEIIESSESYEGNEYLESRANWDNDVEVIESIEDPVNCNRTDDTTTTIVEGLKNCQYYLLENVCIVILKHPTKLYFNGILKASVIVGNVQINGYTLTKEPQTIYSLSGATFLYFETFENHNLLLPNQDLIDLGLNKNDIIESLGPSDCILKFEPCSQSKIHFISQYIKQHFIPYFRKKNSMERFLKCSLEMNNNSNCSFKTNPEWNEPIQSIMSTFNSKTIICGGKNVGKSTLFRYTVNKLLSSNEAVLCLDFDIGQSEFFVSGCVSAVRVTKPLLGPNYTHLQKPDRSYFLGTVNPTDNMTGYIAAIKHILDFCSTNASFQNIPWVINTMGFVRNIGFSIMIHLARMIQPTHIIQISSRKAINNYRKFLSPEFLNRNHCMPGWTEGYNGICTHELFVVNTVNIEHVNHENKNENWKFRPNELRNVSIISYISEILKSENKSLLDVRPVIITTDDVKLVNSNVHETLVPCMFNGNFVALCKEQKIEDNKVLYVCEGFGIVRGIDNKDIYLLTSLKLQTLKNVTHILLAAEPLPPSVYMNTECVDCPIPYVSASSTKRLQTTIAPQRTTFDLFKKCLQNKMKTKKYIESFE